MVDGTGGLYASPMRNEGTALEASIEEALRVGEASGARVQISHLKVDSPSRWGASEKALALIDGARTRGLEVAADQYAYTAASSSLGIRFPARALEGGKQRIRQRQRSGHDLTRRRASSWRGAQPRLRSASVWPIEH